MRAQMLEGEQMAVLVPCEGFHPSPVVLERADVEYYRGVAERSEFIRVASGGAVPLMVAVSRKSRRKAVNQAASWLMLDPEQGFEFPLDKWTDPTGDVICFREDGQDFLCSDAAFVYDFANNILELHEEGKTPDVVKTWALHLKVKKHKFTE